MHHLHRLFLAVKHQTARKERSAMPLMKDLVLITTAALVAHAIARHWWHKGVEHGKETTAKDTELAVVRGIARARLEQLRTTDLISELREAS